LTPESCATSRNRLGDAQRSARRAGPFSVEDACEKPLGPIQGRDRRPGDQLVDPLNLVPALVPDSIDLTMLRGCFAEHSARDSKAERRKKLLGPVEAFGIREGQANLVLDPTSSISPFVYARPDGSVATNHSAEVPEPILSRSLWKLLECADSEHLVVQGQVWAPGPPPLASHNELPATPGQKAVVGACLEFGAVFQGDAIRGFSGCPMGENGRPPVPAIGALFLRPVDRIPDAYVSEAFHTSVAHENRSVSRLAIHTGMSATPKSVDRPVEPEAAAGHMVEHGFRADLVEPDPHRLGCLEGTDRGSRADAWQLVGALG